jgi:hypothetical protein
MPHQLSRSYCKKIQVADVMAAIESTGWGSGVPPLLGTARP